MKKSYFVFVLLGALVLFFNCTKHSDPDPVTTSPCCQNTTVSTETAAWQFFSEQTLDFKSAGPGAYEKTTDGVKLSAQAYRLGSRISTTTDYCVKNTTLRVKWKGHGGSMFADYRISLYYDKKGYGGDDLKRVDFTSLTSVSAFNGSAVIQEDTWYYTRVRIIEGAATAYTSLSNYDDQGGQVVQTRQTTITGLHAGYLAARIGDPYGSTNAYMTINEYKIGSN